jgi:thiamine pyrophosphokinase
LDKGWVAMNVIGIVGGGPKSELPNLKKYDNSQIQWIGADYGTIHILQSGIKPKFAVGDFDSLTEDELRIVKENVENIITFPAEKDQTDVEIAIQKALDLKPKKILLFGVTGGRIDHELVNIQLLINIVRKNVLAAIINATNWIELKLPGLHTIEYDPNYKYISFIPLTETVKNITLEGFYYPLKDYTVEIGSSITVSNQLVGKKGTFSFSEGILLLIKSHDVRQ